MGVTLLTTSQVGPDMLAFCSDTTPEKQGTWIPGLGVPVISPEEARTRRPNVYVLLARDYRDEIIAKERKFLDAGDASSYGARAGARGGRRQPDPDRSHVMTTPAETTKPADLSSLVPLIFGFFAFQQLRAASELQLFEYLSINGPSTSDQIAEGLRLPDRSARKLLLGTTALGLTRCEHDVYEPSDTLRHAIEEGTWPLIRNIIDFQQRIPTSPRRSSRSRCGPAERGPQAPARRGRGPVSPARADARAGEPLLPGHELVVELSNPVLIHQVDYSDVTRVLDVGAATPSTPWPSRAPIPTCMSTVFDLEGAVDVARANIAAAGLDDRVEVVVGDMFGDPMPTGFDLVLFATSSSSGRLSKTRRCSSGPTRRWRPAAGWRCSTHRRRRRARPALHGA